LPGCDRSIHSATAIRSRFIYVNGGLGNRDVRGDRGFDVYKLLRDEKQQFTTTSFNHFNPQTQEVFMSLGG
jgi:hypothetical protein